MIELGFGQKHDMMRCSSAPLLISVLENYNWRMGVYFQCPALTKLNMEHIVQFVGLGRKTQREWEMWRDSFTAEVLDQSDGKEKGAFSRFLDAKDSLTQEPIPFQELWAEAAVWMLAGTGLKSLGAYVKRLLIFLARRRQLRYNLE